MINQARYELSNAILRDVKELTGQTLMARFCSWCGAYRGLRDGKGKTDPTHGICPDCAAEEIAYAKAGGK